MTTRLYLDGEFGPAYAPDDEPGSAETNKRRYALLLEQMRLYSTYPNVSWTIWCWKDIGVCGVTYLNPESEYMRLVKPFLEKKKVSGI
jgi:hypothetical protein